MDFFDLHKGYVVHEGCDHLFFVGFLGAGKSTLARNLSNDFHRDYVDTDRMVERYLGKSVCDIFTTEGESAFRAAELEVLRQLKQKKSLLVSCGGGIVETEEACKLMHEMGTIVYLDGDFEDSLRQIRHPEKRPDFKDVKSAKVCYQKRKPLYCNTADITIDIRDKSFCEVAEIAAKLLWERGLL